MNTLSGILCALFLSVPALAEAPPVDETVARLTSSAEAELAKSIQDLATLRDAILTEKLPLAEELTSLEEKVTSLRRDHERITRLVDAGHLEIATVKAEMKARQDELVYVGNLLDEYARTFESKVHVSELQYCGEAIETAKQATENTTLTMAERFTRQVEFANTSLARLFDVIGGMRFPGVGVDSQGTVVSGQYAIIGPVALFRGESEQSTGVVIPQTGSSKPLIRPLEGPLQASIGSLIATGSGILPLDPSRGSALQALVQKTNLIHIFEKGGPIMWPLLLASVLALGTVLERVFFLMNERRKRDAKALEALFAAVEKGEIEKAIGIGKSSKFFVVRALAYALGHAEQSLSNALVYAQAQELKRFRRGIPILDTVITLAPLLGLLGTVTGMMGSFAIIGGDLSAPGAITGGIAEALIATAFGLGIAITALLPFNLLNTKLEEANHEIESAATQLELLVNQHGNPAQLVHVAAGDAPRGAHKAPRGAQEATHEGHERIESIVPRQGGQRLERELRRRRDVVAQRVAELRSELDDQEIELIQLSRQERGLQDRLVRDQHTKD